MVILFAWLTLFTALQIAQAYLSNVYWLHGMPEVIISDRDRIFTSQLWKELFRLSDTQLMMIVPAQAYFSSVPVRSVRVGHGGRVSCLVLG